MKPVAVIRIGTTLALMLVSSMAISADESVTSVGTVLVNPVSFHRKPVMVQGLAKEVATYERKVLLGREQCGQEFKLEDETGVMDVVWKAWCQNGEEKAVFVAPGDRITVHATIEAPPGNVKNASGSDFGFKAVATKIVRATP